MKKYVALLRGINVSGQKKIKMAELKVALEAAGLQSVQTYIQSGNIVFESEESEEQAAARIEGAIYGAYNFEVPTVVFEQSTLEGIRAAHPFRTQVEDTKGLYVCWMLDEPAEDRLQLLADADLGGDEYQIIDHLIYTCYHRGMGKSKMDISFLEKKLKVRATSRNWNTVSKLIEM
ncbi:DUF1697 domain-containing protein [Reichenbachiella agariperforans]|uniref:Uncharacterized conserved protein, DUF1697 family n=1 Tax=Reichenbachiella agariperforans TaxID=156994 RepID=A0A1M6RBH9_REIAG|nr:DUF1697 domain-containing protein [Reichenbachiella agariperforans]MBU2912881.1 DUF1697 domain-containing protein [Reichenbachiella agariperforans]SHK29770.1 Uncharacterized conserved protein, DUF1697 family [Reichenbachiella agariperforans]